MTAKTADIEAVDRKARRLRRGLAAVFLGALVLLLAHALLVEVFVVGGNSMDPTLRDDDRVLVVKVLDPDRGELVVFRNPNVQSQNVIKRVVARAGDRVAIRDGRVVVNGSEPSEPYLVHPQDHDPSLDMPETLIEAGKIFVLGDNRVASLDSRRALGPIDTRLVVGRAVLALWPIRRL